MKKAITIFTLLLLVSMPGLDTQAQEKATQWYVVWEDPVYPSQMARYEEAAKKQLELYKKYNFPFTTYAHITEDYFFYWAVPITNIADMISYDKEWGNFIATLKANNETDLNEAFKGTYAYSLPRVWFLSPELSYLPEQPRLLPEEAVYQRVMFCYVKPGHAVDFEKKLSLFTGEFKKKNLDSGFETYVGRMGTEMPFYLWIERYKDPLDMWTTRNILFETLGQDIQTIWKDMEEDIRKMEIKTGWSRPDLSYIPAN